MPEMTVAIRLIYLSASISAFGAAAFRFYVPGSGDGGFGRWLGRLIRAAAWIALAASLAMVPATAAGMAGSAAAAFDGSTIALVLTSTQFGHAWLWHLGFAAALAVAAWRPPSALTFALALLTLASLAWSATPRRCPVSPVSGTR